MTLLSFVFESTLFLGCSYGLYYLFLKRSRSFKYIRFYLLMALLVSLVIPFLKFEVHSMIPLASGVAEGEFYTFLVLTGDGTSEASEYTGSPLSIFMVIYLTGMGFMLLRYSVNVIRLILKTKQGSVVRGPYGTVILTDEEGLPYSFFRHIFMNRKTYESGEHREELLLHEAVHCQQAHSADILFAELMKVIQWYNPFAWFMARATRLNHEYLADEQVLETSDRDIYQLLLVNMELANQSNCLASDFKNSHTIKRINMMDKTNHRKNSVIGKMATLPLFLILGMVLSFCEVEQESDSDPAASMEFYANDWWKPILEKHGITLKSYNNFEYIFEMGSTISIDENNVVTLKDAFFLIRTDESSYSILRSPFAKHNLETNIISGMEGSLDTYDLHQAEPEPLNYYKMTNFSFQLVKNGVNITADYIEWGQTKKDKGIMKGFSASYEARDSLVFNPSWPNQLKK
jgi:hypothetical protein